MIPEFYTLRQAQDICVKVYMTKLNQADFVNPANNNKWNIKNWNIPFTNRNPKKPSDFSLIEFCYGRQLDALTAKQIENDHNEALKRYTNLARESVKNGVGTWVAVEHSAADMCAVKCIPWWRNNGKIYRFIDNGLLYTLKYSNDVFTSTFQTVSDPLDFCVKEYESWSSSLLIKTWNTLGLSVFKFSMNNFLKDFCFGRKPDALSAKKMEQNYKKAVNAHINLTKKRISRGVDVLVAVNHFAENLCRQVCLPSWNANALVHYYIYDGN